MSAEARHGGAPGDESRGLVFASARGRWILAVTVLGSGLAFLDGTVVNVALPTIGRDLGASTSWLQWILTGYILTVASLILLGGSLGDRYGRRRVFVSGTALFTVCSLLCAIAPNVQLLVVARLLQGVGGALLTPGSLAIIESSFNEDDRARAIGAWSGLAGVSTALGPLLGGYLVGAFSWRAIFVINVPIGIVVVVMANRHLPETRDPDANGQLDLRGAALAALGLGGTTYALIEGPGGRLSPLVVLVGVAGVIALAAFLLSEARTERPMMPISIFSSAQFRAANLVTFVVYAALGGVFFLLVAFLQIALGYSPIESGAATLPVTALMLVFSARSGAVAQRIGPRVPLAVGPLVIAAGMLLMTRLHPGVSYASSVLPAVVIFGVGLTLVVAPVTATVLASADERHSGIASGINNAVSRVAGLLAVAILPTIAGLSGRRFYDPSDMAHGFRVAMFACAALSTAGGVLAWFSVKNDVLRARPAPDEAAAEAVRVVDCSAVSGTPLRPTTRRR